MILSNLPDAVTILRATTSSNRYGTTEESWSSPTSIATRGHLQPASTDEAQSTDRDAVASSWLLFLPPGTDVRPTDRVQVGGATYRVAGAPSSVKGLRASGPVSVPLERVVG